jgi:hypothetical protein
MAKLHGKEAFIFNNGVKIASLQDLTLSVQGKPVDSTDHDDGIWESSIGGKVAWTATATHVKVLGDATQDAIFDGIVAGSLLPIVIYPIVQSGKSQYSGRRFRTCPILSRVQARLSAEFSRKVSPAAIKPLASAHHLQSGQG